MCLLSSFVTLFIVSLPVLFSSRTTKARFLDVYISTKIRFFINVISLETSVKLISLSHFLSRVASPASTSLFSSHSAAAAASDLHLLQ